MSFLCVFHKNAHTIVIALLRTILMCFKFGQLAKFACVVNVEEVNAVQWILFPVTPIEFVEMYN
jgi:hypothetical protein